MALSTRTAAMAAAVPRVWVSRTRLRRGAVQQQRHLLFELLGVGGHARGPDDLVGDLDGRRDERAQRCVHLEGGK
jgi:hypothetical protein